jgi:hypothetical protein
MMKKTFTVAEQPIEEKLVEPRIVEEIEQLCIEDLLKS